MASSSVLALLDADYSDDRTISGSIADHNRSANALSASVTFASHSYDTNDDGLVGTKRRKVVTQASDLGLTDADADVLAEWCNRSADPFAVHRAKLLEDQNLVRRIYNLQHRLQSTQGDDRVVLASDTAVDDVADTLLNAVHIDRDQGMVRLLGGATPRDQDEARITLASRLEPRVNLVNSLSTPDAIRAVRNLLGQYQRYHKGIQQTELTYAGLTTTSPGIMGVIPGSTGFGPTPNPYRSAAVDDGGTTSLMPMAMMNAFLGPNSGGKGPNGLMENALQHNLPYLGQPMTGLGTGNPQDGLTTYRVTYQDVIDSWVSIMKTSTLLDTTAAHMPFVRTVGSIVIVPKPFKIMSMSMEFDRGFADPVAEETTLTEMTSRQKSEQQGFSHMGKCIRFTTESVLTVKGRQSLVDKSVQLAAAIAQTIEYTCLMALLVRAMMEEERQEKATQPMPRSAAISQACRKAKTWALQHRDPHAWLTQVENNDVVVQRKGINPNGRQRLLITHAGSKGIVGRFPENISYEYTGQPGMSLPKTDEAIRSAQGVKIRAVEAPIFEHDRYTKIDLMVQARQLGEFALLEWDVFSKYGVSTLDFRWTDIRLKFKHHSGETIMSFPDVIGFAGLWDAEGRWTDTGKDVFHLNDHGPNTTIQQYLDACRHAARHLPGVQPVVDAGILYGRMVDQICSSANTMNELITMHAELKAGDDDLKGALTEAERHTARVAKVRTGFGRIRIGDNNRLILFFLRRNVVFPLNLIAAEPHVAYRTAQHLYFAMAPGSYTHMLTNPLVARQFDAEHRNGYIGARLSQAPVMFEGEALVRTANVAVVGYIGGDEPGLHNIWDPTERKDGAYDAAHSDVAAYKALIQNTHTDGQEHQFREVKTFFILADICGRPAPTDPMLDLTGKFSPSMKISARDGDRAEPQYGTARRYSALWGWEHGTAAYDPRTGTSECMGANTLCFLRDHFEYNPVTMMWRNVEGAGHRGRIINDPDFHAITEGHAINYSAVDAKISREQGEGKGVAPAAIARGIFANAAFGRV